MLVRITPSHLTSKKYDAWFKMESGRYKVVPFGAAGMSDYTIHKDAERQRRYLSRHAKEDWENPISAGALSRWVLWSATSLKQGLYNYMKKFGF